MYYSIIKLDYMCTRNLNNKSIKIQTGNQTKMLELQLKAQQLELDKAKIQLQASQNNRKMNSDEIQAMSDIENTRATTMKVLAEVEKISGETVAQQIENITAVSPNIG